MRSIGLTVAALTCALGLGVAAAPRTRCTPSSGRSSSGMGEHGIVNFQSQRDEGAALLDVRRDDEGDHGRVDPRRAGMVVAKLGSAYKAKSCAMVAKKALDLIESKPGSYRVWVDTKGHLGELRGTLFAGMAHM